MAKHGPVTADRMKEASLLRGFCRSGWSQAFRNRATDGFQFQEHKHV